MLTTFFLRLESGDHLLLEDSSDLILDGLFGRVFIAFDDGPLEPNPTWTCIDGAGDFPDQFVSGYDTQSGRQTLEE